MQRAIIAFVLRGSNSLAAPNFPAACTTVMHDAPRSPRPNAAPYTQGENGHRSKDCPAPRNNQAGGGLCFKFQQTGACPRGASCRFAHVAE